MIDRNLLKTKKKNTKSKRDGDENIQSKNEFKAPKSKTNRLKIDERRRTNEEQWRIFIELIMETSRKRYGSTSALIFSFFLLLRTNFKWNLIAKGAKPLPLSPQHHFTGKMEEELAAQLA